METVVEGLMYASAPLKCMSKFSTTQAGFLTFLVLEVTDLISPPDLNQARVNKCLIALVNRKVVQKENSTVSLIVLSNDTR